jgi:hypothetical protein
LTLVLLVPNKESKFYHFVVSALTILDVLDRINTLPIPIHTKAVENGLWAMIKWIRGLQAMPIPHRKGKAQKEIKQLFVVRGGRVPAFQE